MTRRWPLALRAVRGERISSGLSGCPTHPRPLAHVPHNQRTHFMVSEISPGLEKMRKADRKRDAPSMTTSELGNCPSCQYASQAGRIVVHAAIRGGCGNPLWVRGLVSV